MESAKKRKSKDAEKLNFEEGLDRLEEILTLLEMGEVGLEESVKIFKEASQLYLTLQDKLKSAEGEIKVILENGGEIETQDMPQE